jgi:hypothetical protein
VTENTAPARKPKKQRSPSYPALDLDTALARAEQLYLREGLNYAPVAAVVEAWGYGPKSSGGLIAVGALKRYGLIEDKGTTSTREVRLTPFAQAIIADNREDSTERLGRLQEAALKPTIFREVWDKYDGKLPSDSTLQYYLTVERGFTPGGASDFIKKFRQTLEFAQLTSLDATVSETSERERSDPFPAKPHNPLVPSQPQVGAMTPGAPPPLQFPVAGGATVMLQSSAPLSEAAWDQMMTVLETLKPAMVAAPVDERDK